MSELKDGQRESVFSRDYDGDRAMDRYERIRMAVFTPEYLIAHPKWDDDDFTALIDGIVGFQETMEVRKRAIEELVKINGELHRANKALRGVQ